jgi:hypothetical protein
MIKIDEIQVDWFTVFCDLKQQGYSIYDASRILKIPKSTLIGYKNGGAEPKYSSGARLVSLWCIVMEKELIDIPKVNYNFKPI